MYKNRRISVIIPCRNEEKGIGYVLGHLPACVDEVIVVDNASVDQTVAVARAAGARVIQHANNRGYGASYKTGFAHAKGDIIVTGDGDGTYPLHSCQQLIDLLLESEVDFVSARRFPLANPGSMTLTNKIGNALITLVMNLLYGLRLRDSLSGMWAFTRQLLPVFALLESDGFSFSNEIKLVAFTHPTIKAREAAIIYEPRRGRSKLFPLRDGARIVLFLLQRRMRKKK